MMAKLIWETLKIINLLNKSIMKPCMSIAKNHCSKQMPWSMQSHAQGINLFILLILTLCNNIVY